MHRRRIFHPLRSPRGNGPAIPTVPPPLPIQSSLASDPMRWANLPTPGPHQSSSAAVLSQEVDDAVNQGILPSSIDRDPARRQDLIDKMANRDFVFVYGPHQCGKSASAVLWAQATAEKCQADDSVPDESARKNEKFIIVQPVHQPGVAAKTFYKSIHPYVHINQWSDIGGGTFDQSTNPRTPVPTANVLIESWTNITGAVVDEHTAYTMLKEGVVGTVYIENAETYQYAPGLAPLVALASMRMQAKPRTIGRVVFLISSDHGPTGEITLQELKRNLEGAALRVDDVHLLNDPNAARTPIKSGCVFDPSRKKNLREAGFTQMDVMDDVSRHGFKSIQKERLALNEANFNLLALDPESRRPNHEMHKDILHGTIEDSIKEMIKIWWPTELPKDESTSLPDILVICPHREAVAELGNYLTIKKPHILSTSKVIHGKNFNERVYFTSKNSFRFCTEPSLLRDTRSTRIIGSGFTSDIGEGQMFCGRVIITTEEVGVTMELPNLRAVILSAYRQRPSVYKSHGLMAPVSELRTGPTIRQSQSRLGRNKMDGVLLFAGSAELCDAQLSVDVRQTEFNDAFTMNDVINEHTFVPVQSPLIRLSRPTSLRDILDDAKILGVVDYTSPLNVKDAAKLLMTAFPRLSHQAAWLVVVGVKLGVARQVMVLAGIEIAADRLWQQACVAADDDSRQGYMFPVNAIFNEVVANGMSHSARRIGGVAAYESETVITAELIVSFLHAMRWRVADRTKPYEQLLNAMDSGLMTPSIYNFFHGGWSGGAGNQWTNAPQEIRDRLTTRYNFKELYKAIFKDEGRQVLEEALRTMSRCLESSHITAHPDPIAANSADYNRYSVSAQSPLLNQKGVALLSGLIAMSSANFGQNKKTQHKNTSSGFKQLAPRYEVYTKSDDSRDDEEKPTTEVHGYIIWTPPDSRRYASYSRTDAVIYGKNGIRFHARVHPVSLGQLAVFANINGSWKVTMEESPNSATGELSIDLCGSPDYGKIFIVQCPKDLLEYIDAVRGRLATVINGAITRPHTDLAVYEDLIVDLWNFFY